MTNKKTEKLLMMALLVLVMVEPAFAGTGGNFVEGLKSFISDALQGQVGVLIGLSGLLYGLFGGIARGSLGGAGVGFGLAGGSFYGPDIINGMAVATLQVL